MKNVILLPLLFVCVIANAQFDADFNDDAYTSNVSVPHDSILKKRLVKALKILNEFRVQAYVQAEWQRADTSGKLPGNGGPLGFDGVGAFQGGQFPIASNNRFLLRRSRLRISYEHSNSKDIKIIEFALQAELYNYNSGFPVNLKEFYGRIYDPWIGWFSLQGGIFVRPVGLETTLTPAFSESPEFARVNQTIFPNESELGEALVIESPAKFEKFYFRTDVNVVNGQGIGLGFQTGTFQSKKDVIVRVKFGKVWDIGKDVHVGFNVSGTYYNGAVLQTNPYVYQIQKDSAGTLGYVNISDNSGVFKKYFKREYYGAHAEFKATYPLGSTMLRGEFFAGVQPGGQNTSLVSAVGGQYAQPKPEDIFIRPFNGAVFTLTQSFNSRTKKGHSIMHDITLKYDWFDPNTRLNGKDIHVNGTTMPYPITDIKYSTIGVGYSFTPYNWFKLMVWYDHVMNESTNVPNYTGDYTKDDVLTIRTQFYVDTWWFRHQEKKFKDNLQMRKY